MKRSELLKLLSYAPNSPEAESMRRDADCLSRERFSGRAMLLGQIGVECRPCPGKCDFCTFSANHFLPVEQKISLDAQVAQAEQFTENGELDALFLMAMHDFDSEKMLNLIRQVRKVIPSETDLVLNIGDCSPELWREFKTAGISGAYHVLRLREGRDTALDPLARRATIAAIRDAGLHWYYCCEPIGSEHSNEELADAIELGNEFTCYQHAAMARVNFPGSVMPPEISQTRLAQMVAAVTLASADNPELRSIAVHEPNELGLRSGANSIYAEAGTNPRDTANNTAAGRGRSVAETRIMLTETGWL